MEKLVLIDGNSLLNRAYYATPIFTTRSGMPTNAIFGFVKLLFKILDDIKPEYLIVAFDLKAPTFRHKLYVDYKANRKGMPDDLGAQVEPLKNLLNTMKVATCAKEGLEADDIIGTLSKKFDVHSYIYTGDRDSFQLVDEKTDVHYTKKGVSDLQKLNIDNFKTEIGIEPKQIIDLKSLMGDKSDNIQGVAGIGEKIAHDLLARYQSLDGVYEHIDELKGQLKDKLTNNKEMAYLSYKLATIDRNCDLDIDLENCKAPKKYNADVKKQFTDFEFKSLLGLDIFEGDVSSVHENIIYPEKINCTSYEEAIQAFEGCTEFTAFFEKESFAQIYADGKLYNFRIAENLIDEGISTDGLTGVLNLVFANTNNRVVVFGCKPLMHLLKSLGIDFKCSFDDVSLEKYLCDYTAANFDLKQLCEYYSYDNDYPAFAIYALHNKYRIKLESEEMLHLYNDIEKPLLTVLYEMEALGVKISIDMLNELSKRYDEQIAEYKRKIFEGCGCEFNLNSPAQLGQVLYEKLGLTEIRKKKTGKFVTSAEVLEKLTDKEPIVGYVLKFRQYQKLYSTYLEGFRPLIEKGSDIVRTTYNQTTTATGRLSSANPNLQNIPIRENEGRELRKLFVPRNGNMFIDADYSQIELRLLAHFSGCKELISAYKQGIDIHTVTASQVFGVPVEEVTEKMRRDAKAVNFGIIYGMSEYGLSRNLDISVATAHDYIGKYFASYSAVKDYMNQNVAFARKHGYVSTLAGRKRYIPEINSANYNLKQFGERAAMNMPLQGSSADIIKIAMINVYNALKKNNLKTKLILQVHDELVLEAPENEAEQAAEILKYEMENAVQLKVPLTVEVHSGRNWYDAK
ncbi:MAG: DNA polymerase I [Clostridia bacterium]|nr:DNA polymerase I [Clostridia bacterium]